MRGNDEVAGSLFSYVDLEKRVRADHPLRVIRGIVNATLKRSVVGVRPAVFAVRPRIDSAGAAAARRCCCRRSTRSARSANWWNGSSSTCCSAGSSASASMIRCGTPRRSPRTATGCWRVMSREVPRRRAGAAEGQGAAVERAFLGGRHVAGGVGEHQELPAEGRLRPAAGCRAQWGAETSTARSAATTRMPPPPMPDARLYTQGRAARRRSSASWAMR